MQITKKSRLEKNFSWNWPPVPVFRDNKSAYRHSVHSIWEQEFIVLISIQGNRQGM